MADASYERQHLALQAAGYISALGETQTVFGCQMTRISTGHYGLLLDANSGVVNDESITLVTLKTSASLTKSVVDTSNTLKTIFVFNPVAQTPGLANADIEVVLLKTVTK